MKIKYSYITIVFFIFNYTSIFSQPNLFNVKEGNLSTLTNNERKTYDSFINNKDVISIEFIELGIKDFTNIKSFVISHLEHTTIVKTIGLDFRAQNDIGWFGVLSDETGIFVTQIGEMYHSKFYLGENPYSIYSISKNVHLLIRFHQDAVIAMCNTGKEEIKAHFDKFNKIPKEIIYKKNKNFFLPDDNCNIRALILYTTDADNSLNMQLISQGMVDETNLAYIQSQVNFRMELARSTNVTYTEVNTESVQTAYGVTSYIQDDLIRVRNGTNGFGNIPTLRNLYKADVVALIRGSGLGGNPGFFGQAYGVPTGSFDPIQENAFVLIGNSNLTSLIGGRFTFAHEIAHVQGARHDNHSATPNYARGYVINNTSNGIRTIMATNQSTNCTISNSGCRINFFSNPNVIYGGQYIGTATNNNVRRLNETANIVRNFRITNDNLTATTETIANEHTSHHLANNSITTSGSLLYQSGSLGTMRAGTSITLMPGFYASSGSQLRIYTNPNACQALPVNIKNSEIVENRASSSLIPRVRIYPNPSIDYVVIEFLEGNHFEKVYLTDQLGRHLIDKVIESDTELYLDISAFNPGLYFLNLDNIHIEKLVIANK